MYLLLHDVVLSTSKWHTLSPHLAKQSLLLLTLRILPRLIARVYTVNPDTDVANGWAVTANRKRRPVVAFLDDLPSACRTYGLQ